jgi:hypothetical protein
LRVKHDLGNAGKALHCRMNDSSQNQTFSYPYASGTDLLTRRSVEKSASVALAPRDLVIIEKR